MADVQNEWQAGVKRVARSFSMLAAADLERVLPLCRAMMARKGEMQGLVSRVDPGRHCAECGGACCVKGRYHFTAVDLLVYLATGRELFQPLFENGLCPYLGGEGCLMPPEYRPFNCITFNCDRIEDLLTPDEVTLFYRLERELRENYLKIRALFPDGAFDGTVLR